MSLLLAQLSPPPADETAVQATVFDSWRPEEQEQVDYLTSFEVIICTAADDTPTTDDSVVQAVVFESAEPDLTDQQPIFWAIGPPDQDDEPVSAVLFDAEPQPEDEAPFFALGPADQDDEPGSVFVDEGWSTDSEFAEFLAVSAADEPAVDGEVALAFVDTGGEPIEEPAEFLAVTATPDPCVYPYVVDITSGADPADATSHTVTLPGSIVAGQRLIIAFGLTTNSNVTFPAGWTEIFDTSVTGATLACAYRDCDGTESSTISVGTVANVAAAWAIYRVAAGSFDPNFAPIAGAAANGSSANPNPPSLTTGWGSTEVLWIAVDAGSTSPPLSVSAYPTNYTGNQVFSFATGGTSNGYVILATRNLTAATEDPGTFTTSISDIWVANTIAVRGLCPDEPVAQAVTFDVDLEGESLAEFFALSALDDEPSAPVTPEPPPANQPFYGWGGGVAPMQFTPTTLPPIKVPPPRFSRESGRVNHLTPAKREAPRSIRLKRGPLEGQKITFNDFSNDDDDLFIALLVALLEDDE